MIQRLLASGLFAGCAAGLLAALLHFAFVQKILLLGEQYETGQLVHFGGAQGAEAGSAAAPGEHSHAAGTEAHDHPSDSAETSHLKRNALTVLFYALTYAAYGLLLVAGIALAGVFGIAVTARDGLLWGIAGFATFQLAPAMGLAPELPGTVAAELGLRQVWWWGTVLATGTGLALLGYGRGLVPALIGGALLAAPHVIGAPEAGSFFGTAPPEVASAFAARVLGAAFVTWALLGWLAASFWNGKSP